MKKIKIKFVDFWPNFDYEHHFLYVELKKMFDVELSDTPDYLFFSVFGQDHLNYPNAVRIFYTAENISPDFNLCDYAIGFDYLDFGDRYLRFPNYYNYNYHKDFELIKTEENRVPKQEFCCFVYSNSKADPYREKLFQLVSSYKEVKSGGRFKNNVGGPVSDKLEFQKKFKFCIACENTDYPGYTTEKILQAFSAGCIPIYWGDPQVTEVFNEKAFIRCQDFHSDEELLNYIKKVDTDNNLYQRMLHEKVFKNNHFMPEEQLKKLSAFLQHIFKQNYQKAFRYNRTFYRAIYFQTTFDAFKSYQHSIKSIIKKTAQKIRLIIRKMK